MGSAMITAKTTLDAPSSSVTGSRRASSSRTGRRVHSDSPRSPRTTWPSHSRYWTWSGRSRPSLARSSARSRAYAFSSSMRLTTSPGMSRGSAKTISDAMSSDGTATSRRLARYRRSTASAVEPGCGQSSAVVVAEVGAVVLERAVPDGGVGGRRELHVVLLIRQVALDVVDQLAALGDVERAPLAYEQIGDDGIVDVTLILGLAGIVLTVEEVVGVQERRLWPVRHRLELAHQAAHGVGAVLLLVQAGFDPDVLEVLDDELGGVDENRRPVRREAHRSGEAVRIAGLSQETLGLGRIVPVPLPALTELRHRDRPFLQGGRHRRVGRAGSLGDRVENPLAVEGERHGSPNADVVEGRAVDAHRDVRHHVAGEIFGPQSRALLLERVLDLDPVGAVDRAGELPAEVVFPAEKSGQARCVVLVDDQLDTVDVGQAGHEVAGMAHERHPDVRSIAVQHPGTGPDHRLGFSEVTELVDAFLGHDGDRHRVGQRVEEPGEGLLERELDRVLVRRLDLVDRLQHLRVGVALRREEALHAVADVLGRQLAAVHGRLGVPADTAPELEDVRREARLAPRLRDITLDREDAGRHGWAGLVAKQPAMGEGEDDLTLVREATGAVEVEVRRIPGPNPERTAPPWRVGTAPRGSERGGRERQASERQDIATAAVH